MCYSCSGGFSSNPYFQMVRLSSALNYLCHMSHIQFSEVIFFFTFFLSHVLRQPWELQFFFSPKHHAIRLLSFSKTRHPFIFHYKKKKILDGFKPSRNWKKPYGKQSKWFFLDGFKSSRTMGR
jgi:hypothetical protein